MNSESLHVILISHSFPPDMGGASARAWNLAKALRLNGNEVTVVAAAPYYPTGKVASRYRRKLLVREESEGVHLMRVWIPSLPTSGLLSRLTLYATFTFTYAFGLLMMLNQRVGLVYYLSPYGLSIFSLPACIFGKMKNCPVFLDVQDLWPQVITEVAGIESPFGNQLLRVMTKLSVSLCSLVTCVTEPIMRRMANFGVPAAKLHVIELTVDTELFRPKGGLDLTELGLQDKFVVEYSGILGPQYDFFTFLGAAQILSDKTDKIAFLIRGDGELRETVIRSAKNLTNTHIVTKLADRERVVDYLNAANVLICPFRDLDERTTAIPTKVVEYLAVGKPIICAATGTLRELLETTRTGLATEPGNAAALAKAIHYLYRNPGRCRILGKNARNLAISRFSVERLAAELELVYKLPGTEATKNT